MSYRQDLTEAELNGLIRGLPHADLTRNERDMILRLIGEVQRYRDAEAVRMHLANLEGSY